MQKVGVLISLCLMLSLVASRNLDMEAETENDIDKRHLKVIGDLMKTKEAQDIVKNAMILFGNLLSPGKRDVFDADQDKDMYSVVPEDLQQTVSTRTIDLKWLGDLMKTPEAQAIAKDSLHLLGKLLSPNKHKSFAGITPPCGIQPSNPRNLRRINLHIANLGDVLEVEEYLDSLMEELSSMQEA